jgi:hypothetical protein
LKEILSGEASNGNTYSERTNAGQKEALKGVSMKSEKKSERTLSPEKQGLSKAAQELLSRVRASPSPEVVYGLPPGAAEAKAHSVIDPLIEGTGLPVARLNQYRWFLAELCRLMRTRSGPDLAYCMEYALRKWLSFGLEPNSVVVLASELFDRLKPQPGLDSSEFRNQRPEFRTAGVEEETAKDAKSAKEDSENPESRIQSAESRTAGPEPNDERRTSNEPTSGGGGP